MPIRVPGYRSLRSKKVTAVKRNIVAVLQLTAMVDLFTVLVVFLLQNYASTNQILPISDAIVLPKATATKSLSPSFVVVLSRNKLSFNGKELAQFQQIKTQKDWMIYPLRDLVMDEIEKIKSEKKQTQVLTRKEGASKILEYEKMTLQADENIDFLTIKKIMFTLQEAGIKEINFAVIQIKDYPSS